MSLNVFPCEQCMNVLHLTHWGRATHICVSNLTIIASDNGLSPGRRQAIIWTSAGILLIGPLGTNFSEILVAIITFSFMKMRLKVSSAKWRPCCLGLNVLMPQLHLCDLPFRSPLHCNETHFIFVENNDASNTKCDIAMFWITIRIYIPVKIISRPVSGGLQTYYSWLLIQLDLFCREQKINKFLVLCWCQCFFLLISMLWHRQANFKSKGDKLFSSAECRIRTQSVSGTESELSRIKWKTLTEQPVPMIYDI